MPIKKYLKENPYCTCDNKCQRNMGTKRIYETKISSNRMQNIKKNIEPTKDICGKYIENLKEE